MPNRNRKIEQRSSPTLLPDLRLATLVFAQKLIGCRLVALHQGMRCSGMIVETEAYLGSEDEASHAYRGVTTRNAAMFGPPGRAYVYLSYGVHCCVNVVTESAGVGAAVLIRALEPLEGVAEMRGRRNRHSGPVQILTSGPGRLCSALGITLADNGAELYSAESTLRLEPCLEIPAHRITATTRIGISRATEKPWRFCLSDSRFISVRSRQR